MKLKPMEVNRLIIEGPAQSLTYYASVVEMKKETGNTTSANHLLDLYTHKGFLAIEWKREMEAKHRYDLENGRTVQTIININSISYINLYPVDDGKYNLRIVLQK